MAAIYQFLSKYEVLIYILLAIGELFAFRLLLKSWGEWRKSVYTLEREFALHRMSQATATVILILILFFGELTTVSFIIPGLPASFFIPTPTIDVLATPTGTISAELATQIALTPPAVPTPGNTSGCVSGKLVITSPKPGTEISGSVDIVGTVDIPDFGFYKYEVAPLNADTWATIAANREPVDNGTLGQWDTTTLTPGDYQLRLVVINTQGQSLTPCVIPLRIAAP
ncbi:MAG TPA: hypothetical protein VLZ89_10685 [Anaerolineales bacterium]|nr:hypothetical protein [Anaerolineales bacterium]